MPLNFEATHFMADAAGQAAPVEEGSASIELLDNSNFTRWLRKHGLPPAILPLGYAKAYARVLQQAGERVRIVRE